MKSFRGGKQRQHASIQVILTLLVLLTSILLIKLLPVDSVGHMNMKKSSWESSVVKLP